MSNPAAIFYYDEQATNLRSKLVQQGGKKLLFSSVKNFKPPKVAKKKPANNNNNFVSNSVELDRVVTALHTANSNYKEMHKRYRSFLTVLQRRIGAQRELLKKSAPDARIGCKASSARNPDGVADEDQSKNIDRISDIGIMHEVGQHAAFMRSDFITQYTLKPYATELLVWYALNEEIVSAGQVDAVMRSRDTGEFY